MKQIGFTHINHQNLPKTQFEKFLRAYLHGKSSSSNKQMEAGWLTLADFVNYFSIPTKISAGSVKFSLNQIFVSYQILYQADKIGHFLTGLARFITIWKIITSL